MKWSGKHGVWVSGPFTVQLQHDARTKQVIFELYNHTCFVKAFSNVRDAKEWARGMQYMAMERAS